MVSPKSVKSYTVSLQTVLLLLFLLLFLLLLVVLLVSVIQRGCCVRGRDERGQ
eukprot:COSAG02_NODE_15065_length_1208_cov_1.373309_2_plen_52_part_01